MKIIECPRDAMQGLTGYIPAIKKAEYINLLLGVGFDTIDFGSFVSPTAVPQMRDTVEVLSRLDLSNTRSGLLAIVANNRGIADASQFDEIRYLGFPFSISETFQRRNTNTGITASLKTVEQLVNSCSKSAKIPVIYLSMGFGNPYGDEWSPDIAARWVARLADMGATIMSLSDTVGIAKPREITTVFERLISAYPGIEFGAHLHSLPDSWQEKVNAAYLAGCRRFDSALKGYGGCPMAANKLTGNIATENLLEFLSTKDEFIAINVEKWNEAQHFAGKVFPG